ncbi:hypothetical protein [Brucella anthropi]|uniref:hypothetical protein n=1 Tax=Brucella anthropi TaxID=529 RepID=UPI00320A9A14
MWQWLADLKPAQATVVGSCIAAIFGFGTLTVGALFNAHLNRKRDDRLEEIKRLSLLRGIFAEISLIRNLLAFQLQGYRSETHSEKEWHSSASPKTFTVLYLANASNLSVLPKDALTQVIIFYAAVDEYEYNIKTDGGEFPDHGLLKARSFNYSKDNVAKVIQAAETLKNAAELAIPHLANTIKSIERSTKIRADQSIIVDVE